MRLGVWTLGVLRAIGWGGLAVAGVAAAAIFVWVPPAIEKAEISKGIEVHQARLTREYLERATQTLLGLATLLGLYLLWRRVRSIEESAWEGRMTERFDLAVKQLSSRGEDKSSTRMGGIYLLERILRESPVDALTVRDLLAAFVREEAPYVGVEGRRETPRADVQAALTVLGRNGVEASGEPFPPLDLHRVDLRGAQLRGAALMGINLIDAHLERAELAEARLQGALLGGAWLNEADLSRANLEAADLDEACLNEAVLDGANLQHASLFETRLEGAWLQGADLRRTALNPERAEEAITDEQTQLPWSTGANEDAPRRGSRA